MIVKSSRQRITELIGSMLASALVAAVTCVVMMLIYSHGQTVLRPERVVWLLLTSTAGAWAILIPSKVWEGTRGEPSVRRFVMMVAGAVVGMLACFAADALLVDLPPSAGLIFVPRLFHFDRNPSLFAVDGRPLMLAYVAAFGTVFFVVRWWYQANPLRSKRLSIWSLVVCTVLASMVADLWQFPQPWLPMAIATISVSVQLASPWLSPAARGRKEGRDGIAESDSLAVAIRVSHVAGRPEVARESAPCGYPRNGVSCRGHRGSTRMARARADTSGHPAAIQRPGWMGFDGGRRRGTGVAGAIQNSQPLPERRGKESQ